MTTRICKIEKFIPKNGNPVLQVHEEAEIGGRIVSLDPRNPNAEELQDADEKFAAAQQAKIAELESQLSAMTAERDSLASEKAALTTERDLLQDRIDELTAIAEQPICTNFQIRAWLITKFGLGIIDKVTAMIASIPDATQRLLANQQWEYANNVLRDNPFVEQIAAALGMKSDEMDAAYLEASKIV